MEFFFPAFLLTLLLLLCFNKPWKLLAVFVGLLILLLLGLSFQPVGNAWFLMTDSVFIIPKESSVWRFSPTVMNDGSGDWWLYGEDGVHFYHFVGGESVSYLLFPREAVKDCTGFDPHDVNTWCEAVTVKVGR